MDEQEITRLRLENQQARLMMLTYREAQDATLDHLGAVLYFLADLHPDDRCAALDNALAAYNAARPNAKVGPSGMDLQRLVSDRSAPARSAAPPEST